MKKLLIWAFIFALFIVLIPFLSQAKAVNLMGMGDNGFGQIGAANTNRLSPVNITTDVSQMAAGCSHSGHSFFLKTDGTLWAMGYNWNGQLGDGTTTNRVTPVLVATNVSQVAAGSFHSLFVKTNGTLWATGYNGYGQLGDGTTTNRLTPVQVATNVLLVTAGSSYSLFVKTDGTLWAMGLNSTGQLGDGTTTNRSTPVQVASGVSQVTAGSSHSLFVKTDASLWAMGSNNSGRLGDGTTIDHLTPIQIATNVSQAAAGGDHSLFVKTDGTLWAMGRNESGQLGDGTTVYYTSTPTQTSTNVLQVSAGYKHSLFVKTDGTLWAMGLNSTGQLGDGTNTNRSTPVQVASGVSQVTAGSAKDWLYSHSFFVKTDGSLWGMGYNGQGQLGDGTTSICVTPVQTATNVLQVTAGLKHSLFIKTDGTLWAMGDNSYGQLGDGTNTTRITSVQVDSDVYQVTADRTHSLFVKTDGSLWAMGNNSYGQLGDGTTGVCLLPVQITTTGVSQVAAGNNYSLFIKTDGSLWAMGLNSFGQLGDGTTTNRVTPVLVATDVSQMALGTNHSLFVKTDGSLWAMGYNSYGQLGDGTTTNRSTPVQVASGVSQVTAGIAHSLFVKTDGSLWAMGYNSYGQLGNGTTTSVTPVIVATDVSQVTTRYRHSLFIKTDGSLWAMGDNRYGQFGNGTSGIGIGSLLPVQIAIDVSQATAGYTHSLFFKMPDAAGMVFIGYQGWFNCEGDKSPFDIYSSHDAWRHWSAAVTPSPGNQTFELFPYISDYKESSLYGTNYSNFPNGKPAMLFSSYSDDTIDEHFEWMETYGLDGVALQRFGTDIYCDPDWPVCWIKDTVDQIATKVKNSAEKHDRLFYVMYDISGMQSLPGDFLQQIKSDWLDNIVGNLNLTTSPNYAKRNGKNVVGIWGIGFVDNIGSAEQSQDLIDWFKTQGCFVIGGVPIDWRTGDRGETKPDFLNVFTELDVISPWTVGRYSTDAEIDNYRDNYLLSDKIFCESEGIGYQPVIFPGFSWSNWNGGSPNEIPRRGGKLFWRQAYNIADADITSAYIAMFDEYDEATAIAKSAEDFSMVPPDQYFLTLSADGIFISSDFYLRLASEATKMIKSEISTSANIPIPYSNGPVFFRSGAETGYDAVPTWTDSTDISGGGTSNVIGFSGSGGPECGIVNSEESLSGVGVIRYSGKDISNITSYQYFKVFDVDIPVGNETTLNYSIYPQQSLGRFVGIDLIMTDGTTLRDSGAVDLNGNSMHPAAGRGSVGGWNKITCNIGKWLDGKTIDRILIAYDNSPLTGDFRGYIDDISISNQTDSDGDGIPDAIEDANQDGFVNVGETDPNDQDTDDDGIMDGVEDANQNGQLDAGETNPCNPDTDGDGIQDGTELGYTTDEIGPDTDTNVFIPDADDTTVTDPLLKDTDGDGFDDGQEDINFNGSVDQGEKDPNQKNTKGLPFILLLLD